MKIEQQLIDKIDHILSFGLTKGLGQPKEGEFCVEAAICYALGEPHTDKPSCVGENVRQIKIRLNDCNWSSNKARAEGMRNLAIAQLGSNTLDQKEFLIKLKDKSNERLLPYLVSKHKKVVPKEAQKLDELCVAGWNEVTRIRLHHYYNSYRYYYNYYNYYNKYNNYNYNYNYNYYLGAEWLLLIADTILEVLKDMKSPGCAFL